ncbi:MAG: hypothetical protein A3J48_00970 [Candidatus Doudnabacteria bacterium RIFCSPHIGHO2_02_FULL_46_11]|uniref:Type II secretion system protein GspF domain-containing protein n=1 Tax=Candidatus Doudnabacteria bacterium RIFCSPHIGHO2_02_FULL_46_11 TaxID=1817832 RepID=A0A1F5P7L4_9BACT|nr:MAG: hypothetical protein A3J48_00970 [Candidatus Doudnabacteria bacterium RIFCSPHIGHO2_02_FULL_46_11]
MAIFRYEAANSDGTVLEGDIEAADRQAVLEFLTKRSLVPLAVEDLTGQTHSVRSLSISLFERVTSLDRILLVRNLGAALKAGLNLLEALDILIVDTAKTSVRRIMAQAKVNLQNGQMLSATFKAFPKYFPPVFVGLIKAGEASGQLDRTLKELNDYLIREYDLNRKIKSALAYPVLLLSVAIGVVVLLLIFVLPRLERTFQQTATQLPLITRILVQISEILTYSLTLDLIVIGFFTASFIYLKKTAWGKKVSAQIAFRIPLIRDLVKKIVLVRFTKTLATLLASGLPIIMALELSAEAVGNEAYRQKILKAADEVKSGTSLSKSLSRDPQLFPGFLTGLMLVGEKTGTSEEILKTFADFYTEEVDHELKNLTNFIEPLLLLMMGLVIGLIALSILLPIYQLVGKFT